MVTTKLSVSDSTPWLFRPAASIITAGICLLPILLFTVFVYTNAVNVPWMDDLEAFLKFILSYQDAPTLAGKIDWLLRPNNEHRILFAKLATITLYNLTGQVNFATLILVAYLFLLTMLWVLYRVFRSMNLPIAAFIPVPFILLQPQYYLTSLWAVTGLQHEVVICLVIVTLYLLAGGKPNRFGYAIGIQLIASLSMSNGLFGWVAGAFILLLQGNSRRLLLWIALAVGTIVFYFHDFPNSQGNDSSVAYLLQNPHIVVAAFFTFVGALFDFFPKSNTNWRYLMPTLAGLIVVGSTGFLLIRMNWPFLRKGALRPDKAVQIRRYFFSGAYAFLLVNATVVAVLRPRFGYSVMVVSNYMIYPALIVVLVYLNVISEYYSRKPVFVTRWVMGGIVVGVLVWGISYGLRLPVVAARKETLLTNAYNQQHNQTGLGPTWGTPFDTLGRYVMGESVRRGLYTYPTGYYTPYATRLGQTAHTQPDSSLRLHVSQLPDGGYAVTTDALQPQPARKAAVLVQAEANGATYLFFSTLPYQLKSFWRQATPGLLRAEVVSAFLAPGRYRIGVLNPADESNPVRISTNTLVVVH
ncbi:hypothetical protein [Spirosoma rhododendri]|uniref:Glycosyltransferase RgtA/B/C/D-like domain-containing protein n=1 Tax=Spirosoma rhododendri TaxID=2728024 RepID=A0A7L5DNG9_9BACT|nr:hypothetical protein [Spirosoma rhododendri]QJD79102.1 hypothetical protein HH216_12235 [Spirosoma rhododendri]